MEEVYPKHGEHEPENDSEQFARKSRLVLRQHGVDVDDPEIAAALAEIAEADPETAIVLVMDLMGNAGLEPDEAFTEVIALSEGAVEEVVPNTSQRVAAICGALLAEHGTAAPEELEAISGRTGRGALGTAADLLVDKGVFASTQQAIEALDPDGALQAEADAQ